MLRAYYDTLIVTFCDPIKVLDCKFFSETWRTASLKDWIDDFESTRMTPINEYTAVITSENNMEKVKEWLNRNTPIAEMKEL